jgi:hypothetical protein
MPTLYCPACDMFFVPNTYPNSSERETDHVFRCPGCRIGVENSSPMCGGAYTSTERSGE